MICLTLAQPGQNIGAVSGGGMAVLNVTVPTIVSNPGTNCSGGYVLITSDEYAAISTNPFNLALSDGSSIAAAVLMVWSVGFGIRWVIRALRISDSSSQESD